MSKPLLLIFCANVWNALSQNTDDLKPPTPEGVESTLLVAYMLNCEDTGKKLDLTDMDNTNNLSLIVSEECQGDPFTDYTKSMQVWCRPNNILEFRSYDNINCRGDFTRTSSFANGFCDLENEGGSGFVVNWNEEHWKSVCAPPDQESKTKGEFCRKQGQKEGRKSCLRYSCCTWAENVCVANAKECSDRKKVQSCKCPGGGDGVAVNPIADVNDDKQDGCSCPKKQAMTCATKIDDEWAYTPTCVEENDKCWFMQYSGDIDEDLKTVTECPSDKPCCTNSICVECNPDKPELGHCNVGDSRSEVQSMLLGHDFGTQLDLIGCAMSFLEQRTDPSMGSTLCNCYTSFDISDWGGKKRCWINNEETKDTNSQFKDCEDYLGISLCATLEKRSKCRRKHQCVWSETKKEDGEIVKRDKAICIPSIHANDICFGVSKPSKCAKMTECVWRHDEGCISNGPFSCEGLKRSKCKKQCGCFFQNPYGCRKNRHRHDRDKTNTCHKVPEDEEEEG